MQEQEIRVLTLFEPCREKICFRFFSTRSDTNRALQPQKIARGLKFQSYQVKGLYFLCSTIEGADELHQLICMVTVQTNAIVKLVVRQRTKCAEIDMKWMSLIIVSYLCP